MKIKILNPLSDNCTIKPGNFFRDCFDYFSSFLKDEPIEWGDEGKLLAVTNVDLDSMNEIDWHDINLIIAETCQQIYDLSYKLDYTKSYIFVTESWIDIEVLKEKFYGLPIIAHYAVFNEVFNYGSELFAAKSHITALKISDQPPEYNFFCIIGRQTNLRRRFIYELSRQDLSKSLVKYYGEIIGNSGAPAQFDQLDYRNGFFGSDYHYGMTTPSKLIQSSLYNNFKVEVQFETDATGGQGWDLIEYHVTEKTLKPLIMGKPCLMFGPIGYHKWLLQYNIDLGLGNFKNEFDSIENDQQRAAAVATQVRNIDFDTILSNQLQHQQNMLGLHQLCNFSKQNTLSLYRQLRLLTS